MWQLFPCRPHRNTVFYIFVYNNNSSIKFKCYIIKTGSLNTLIPLHIPLYLREISCKHIRT